MREEKIIARTYVSEWKNEIINKTCRIIGTYKNDERTGVFTFRGHNPFPCFSMTSRYHTIAKWLRDNGWEQTEWNRSTIHTDVIDADTGEVLRIIDQTREMSARYVEILCVNEY